MSVFVRYPYFLDSVPFLDFPYSLGVFRSKEIADLPNTFFHVTMAIVVIVTVIIYLIFHKFRD